MNRFLIIGITLLLSASLFNYASRVTVAPLQKEGPHQEQSRPTPTQPTPTQPTPTQAAQPTPTQPVPTQVTQPTPTQPPPTPPKVENEKNLVKKLVEDFGKKLQMVSLSAPPDLVSRSMRENYSNYLSPALLGKWQKDPRHALGRVVSSPWPDRIDILKIEKTSESVYKVSGEIIEITSVEKVNGGIAAKRPVAFVVKKIGPGASSRWLIDEVNVGSYVKVQPVIYKNTQYGFNFSLPNSWKGYTIVTAKWEGNAIGDARIVETGPEILIRHPKWTQAKQRQDIPIMIFTLAQWDSLQREKYHIGAAPMGPSELGRNNSCVFALPARYNYAFPTGFEEVEEILRGKPLHPFDIDIPQAVIYNNAQYGFKFSLPDSWKGYTIVTAKWEGNAIGEDQTVETGPEIVIRHPQWTQAKQRQDIPIMIFTLAQWDSLQREKYHIGAAPMGPSELDRNNSYVFALPARYNYAFPTGFEEVEEILRGKPLHPFDIDIPQAVIYKNAQYGFNFSLPDSWKGYTIVTAEWVGNAIGDDRIIETGTEIVIRHPQWTLKKQRQDIPLLIFTPAQWDSLQQEKYHIGAAPIGPSELGRNNSYVFALPARYNYAFPTGYEEVEEILKNKSLQPFDLPN